MRLRPPSAPLSALAFAACLGLALGACTVQLIEPSDRICDESHPCQAGQSCVEGVCTTGGDDDGGHDAGHTDGGSDAGTGSDGGTDGGTDAGTDAGQDDPVEVTVEPATLSLPAGETHTFVASVSGGPMDGSASDAGVTWSIQEGPSGGSITAAGEYTAPLTVGTWHVVATSKFDSKKSATVEVTVVLPGVVSEGLEAHFSADRLLGEGVALPADGTAISNWLDLGPSGRHVSQSSASFRPVMKLNALNGRPVVSFDGVDDYLLAPIFAAPLPQPNTIVFVYRASQSGSRVNVIDAPTGTGERNRVQITETGGPQLFTTMFTTIGSPRSASSYHVLTAVFHDTASVLRVDGQAENLGGGTPGTGGMGGIILGMKQDLQPPAGPLQLAELLVYDRALDASEIIRVEAYLRARYGL